VTLTRLTGPTLLTDGGYIGPGRVWPGPKVVELGQYVTVSSGVGESRGIEWYTVNTLQPPKPIPVLVPEPNPEPEPHPSHDFWAKVGTITGGVVATGVTVWWAGKVASPACGPGIPSLRRRTLSSDGCRRVEGVRA
jgi:hypothetical protein